MDNLSGQTINGYLIGEQIGVGGFGAVYRAYEPSVQREVAIKVILPAHASKPEFARRFESEAQTIARLEHPHIIPLYSYWQDERGAFLVMRYVAGGSLRARLDTCERLSLAKTQQILSQIAPALAKAHAAGVIHRDLKPDNILLDEQGNAYLTDFGIAKNLHQNLNLTEPDTLIGSPAYFTPEQIRGETVTPQTDIYSLGIVLYEMLKGAHPFASADLMSIVRHVHEPIPPLPDLSPAVNAVIQKATAKNPAQRYTSVTEMAAALQQTGATPESPTQVLPPLERPTAKKSAPSTDRNRARMLQKVRSFWVEGVLEKSLPGAVLLELGMAYESDAVDYPWEMVLQQPATGDQSIPHGTKIGAVFQQLNGELLILGAPGSGKTTTLLELTRDLLDAAESDPALPIPVVFNLSSWAERQAPLGDWMTEELRTKYQVPPKVAGAWIVGEHILPLLDGLDEVRLAARNACVEAINAYRGEHGFNPMVVCSRLVDYQALTRRLKLQGAIVLQPLTPPQVETYLGRFGQAMRVVQAVLDDDAKLRELVKSPLLLNIVTLAYHGIDVQDFPQFETLEGRREHLFASYVDRMLTRRGTHPRYTPAQTRQYLGWLARRMSQEGLSVFHIEDLQPDWLEQKSDQRWYAVLQRLIMVIILLLPFMIRNILEGIITGDSLSTILLDNLELLRPDSLIFYILLAFVAASVWFRRFPIWLNTLIWGVGSAVSGWVILMRVAGAWDEYDYLSTLMTLVVIFSGAFSLSAAFIGSLMGQHRMIQTDTRIGWSHQGFRTGITQALVPAFTVCVFFISGLYTFLSSDHASNPTHERALVMMGLAIQVHLALLVAGWGTLLQYIYKRQQKIRQQYPLQKPSALLWDDHLRGGVRTGVFMLGGLLTLPLALPLALIFPLIPPALIVIIGVLLLFSGAWWWQLGLFLPENHPRYSLWHDFRQAFLLTMGSLVTVPFAVTLFMFHPLIPPALVLAGGLLKLYSRWRQPIVIQDNYLGRRKLIANTWMGLGGMAIWALLVMLLLGMVLFGVPRIVGSTPFNSISEATGAAASILMILGAFYTLLSVIPALILAVGGGIMRGIIVQDVSFQVQPNQGIRRALTNAARVGLGTSLLFGVILGAALNRVDLPTLGIQQGVYLGIAFAMATGGLAALQHFILRGLLYRRGDIPGNYADFLDYAAERILLRKVGGGYVFMHRLLLAYLAGLAPEKPKRSSLAATSEPLEEIDSHRLHLHEEDSYQGIDDLAETVIIRSDNIQR